jgi:hypothetical protein
MGGMGAITQALASAGRQLGVEILTSSPVANIDANGGRARGDVTGAAHSFQRGLTLDAKLQDPRSEAFDWFNYGQFLRRRGVDLELAYACYLRAEILLGGKGGENQQTVETARREVEMLLGKKAATVQKNLPELLTRAQNLPASAFQ